MIDCYLYEGKSETKFSCYFWVNRDRKSTLMCFDMWPYFLFTWLTTCSGTCHSICWHFQSPSSRRRHLHLKYNLPVQWWCCHQIEIANLRDFFVLPNVKLWGGQVGSVWRVVNMIQIACVLQCVAQHYYDYHSVTEHPA